MENGSGSGDKGEKFPLRAATISNTFPEFKYHLSALCPLQHMVAFASPTDERIALYVFRHDSDGSDTFNKDEDANKNQIADYLAKGIK